jgi:ATP-binding cassette subfamily C (CFTR/MRP) protein 4
VNFFK